MNPRNRKTLRNLYLKNLKYSSRKRSDILESYVGTNKRTYLSLHSVLLFCFECSLRRWFRRKPMIYRCCYDCRYTMFGGLYSVACTDALQLACIVIGLGVAAPFSTLHPAVSFEKNLARHEWLGEIKNEDLAEWVDSMLVLVFGGIPWQVLNIHW